MRKLIVNVLNTRFSILAVASQTPQAVTIIQSIGVLNILFMLLHTSGERVIRILLNLPTQGDLV